MLWGRLSQYHTLIKIEYSCQTVSPELLVLTLVRRQMAMLSSQTAIDICN